MADYDELAQADTRVNQIPTGMGGAPSANPYDDLATQEMAAGYANMRQSLGIALKQDPDSVAKRKLLSDQTGIPLPVVERNDEIIQMQQRAREIQAAAQQSPILRRQLADPKFAALAHDSAENLSAVETAVRQLTGAPRALMAGLLTDFNAGAWGLAEASARTLGAQDTGDYFRRMRKTQEAIGAAIQGDYGRAGLGEGGVAAGFRSFGGMLPATVASVLTGNPSFMLASGGVTSGGQATSRGLDAGLNPAQALLYGAQDATAEVATEMIPVARLFKDLKAGTPFFQLLGRQLALEVPTEMAATTWQNFNEWANINPQKSFEDYLVELGPDQAQTVVATVTQTILSAGLASGAARLTRRYQSEREQAAAAEQDAATLAQINALAAADKLRTRDPRSFEQFVAAAAEDGPVQEVYLDARTLQQAGVDLQALAQASPAVAAQVAEAIATGGDIVIPVSEYAARVAGTDLDPLLTPHLRTAEDGLSLDEAQRFYQDQAGRMSQAAQQAMAEREQDVAWRESAKQVEDDLRAQLQNTGRFTNDVNNAYATLMRDFYVTTAQRLGITPLEMFQRYPIQVRAESVAAEQRMEQEGRGPAELTREEWLGDPKITSNANAGDLAPRAYSFLAGVPPEPFLGDKYTVKVAQGGAAVFDGDKVIASYNNGDTLVVDKKYRRQGIAEELVYQWRTRYPAPAKAGTRTKASQAIQEKVWERIQREQGRLNQSPQPTSPLQRLAQSFLQAIGVQTPAAQQPAAQAGDAMDMGQFFQSEQPAVDQTETPEFKRWFGDSKVVDAEGKPLVVYHATTASFDAFQENARGIHFVSPSAAWVSKFLTNSDGTTADGANVLPVFVKSSNPFDYENKQHVNALARTASMGASAIAQVKKGSWARLEDRTTLAAIKRLGFDGLYVNEDGVKNLGVFNPEQIKSAIGNRGTFDPNDPNILNQPAYHGSPYKFDKFTLDNIGGGEGAQVYGWGLYFAGNREVAEYYRNALKPPTEIRNWRFGAVELYRRGEYVDYSQRDSSSKMAEARAVIAEDFFIHEGDITRAFDEGGVEAAKTKMREVFDARVEGNDRLKSEFKILRGAFDRPNGVVFDAKKDEGQLYTVDIPEDDNYLLWDKPLSEQPEKVREALLRAGFADNRQAIAEFDDALFEALQTDEKVDVPKQPIDPSGERVYTKLTEQKGSDEAASKYLNSLGVLGIKYLDGSSRAQGEGSFNYVIFDDSAIQILDTLYQAPRQEGNRGEIAFARDVSAVPSVITLFKTADLSTFLHEMGHFQLEVLANIASRPDAPQALVDDFNAALKWFGITGNQNVRGGEQGGALGQSAVESDAFREWFGDSKVVDAEGKPLVVYRGGATEDWESGAEITAFRSKNGPWSGFFTSSPDVANRFASVQYEMTRNGGVPSGVFPVYLSLTRPLEVDAGGKPAREFQIDASVLGKKDHPIREKLLSGDYDSLILRNTQDEGDVFVPLRPEQIKSAIGNRGTFDPNDPNILNQGGENGVKGPLPPGRTPLEVWQAMSLEEKRPYHEQFARGFEAYLFEGKAPNAELDTLFARFRAWLINVYKSIKALNVELNDEIRGVFDRLVASQDAINQAEAVRSYAPLFTEPAANMDPAEWEQYQDLASEATQKAISDLQRRSLRDMQWLNNARGRVLKQLQRDAKDKRKAVETEVRAEVQAMPVYAAMRFLKRGEMVTEEGEQIQVEKGHKLDTDALAEMYPETMLARPGLDGLRGMTRKDGLHPDLVAEMFGFTSGDQLVREILSAEPEASVIEGMTDQRVLERYGDLANPDTIARAADEAIHNEARARFVATELKALTSAAGPVRAMTKAAKDFASALVARKKLRDIKPNQHASAEARAAKAAQKAMAEGDTAQAAVQKRNQLVQNYATRLSYEALDEVDKAVAYLRKFDREGVRKSIDTEYTDQIDQLLERFDLRASTPLAAGQKRASLLAWVETQRERGFEPDIPPELITEAQRKPYREMTLEEMRGLVDTVKQIEHLGRLKKKLLTAQDEREFQAIRDEIAASIEANARGVRELRTRNNVGAMLKEGANKFLAMHRKMASVAREMDGFQDGGPMWEYLIRSMNAAGNVETEMRAAATAELHTLLKPVLAGGPMGGKGQYFPTLRASFNREERIAIALNMGNAGNMQRLMDGAGWTQAQLQPLLDTITPQEAQFVQAVWDFFESYRPQIAAKERRIYGKEPEWVEPAPITLGGQQLRGGYYPIKYDTAASGQAERHAEAEAAKQQMRGAYTTATTRRSFIKSRAEEVTGRPLLYSFAGLYQGTNEVIHDLSWHEWLIDANRLLRSLDLPIRAHYGPETVALFKSAIQDIAAGDVPAQNVFEKGINHLRVGATVAGLGWNFSTALLQPFGLTQSMVRIGPGWVAKGLGQWLKNPIATGDEVQAKSAFMRDRARTMQREINEIQNQVRGSKLDPVRATFFLFIQKAQIVADMPTWLGAYEKAIADGQAEDRAVALADQAVLDAQGGGQMKDLAQIQRGGPLLKLWTNFYSFFNTTYNLAVEKTKQKAVDPKLYPSLAMDYLLLFTIPTVMVSLVKAALSGDLDDEDKLVEKLIADQIGYLLGTMVGLREVTAAAQKVAGVEQFKSNYGGPAGLRMLQEIDKLATQAAQGEADAALLKAANNVAGNLFHYPSGQINRTVEGTAALLEGRTENPAAVLLGPPR